MTQAEALIWGGGFKTTPVSVKVLLEGLCSGVTPNGPGNHVLLVIDPRSTACKATTLIPVLSSQPRLIFLHK